MCGHWFIQFCTICKINFRSSNEVTLNWVFSCSLGAIWLTLCDISEHITRSIHSCTPYFKWKDTTYHEPRGTGQLLHDHKGRHNTWRTSEVTITNRVETIQSTHLTLHPMTSYSQWGAVPCILYIKVHVSFFDKIPVKKVQCFAIHK